MDGRFNQGVVSVVVPFVMSTVALIMVVCGAWGRTRFAFESHASLLPRRRDGLSPLSPLHALAHFACAYEHRHRHTVGPHFCGGVACRMYCALVGWFCVGTGYSALLGGDHVWVCPCVFVVVSVDRSLGLALLGWALYGSISGTWGGGAGFWVGGVGACATPFSMCAMQVAVVLGMRSCIHLPKMAAEGWGELEYLPYRGHVVLHGCPHNRTWWLRSDVTSECVPVPALPIGLTAQSWESSFAEDGDGTLSCESSDGEWHAFDVDDLLAKQVYVDSSGMHLSSATVRAFMGATCPNRCGQHCP